MGHIDHGKTTLTAAITKVLHDNDPTTNFTPFDQIDKAPEEKQRGTPKPQNPKTPKPLFKTIKFPYTPFSGQG